MDDIHAGFPETSIFYGRDIKARVHVDWGTFSLVAALKELIMSGLEDRLNQKFMLISESGIPLYPGETMWVELMVEEKSRINACELGVHPSISCLSFTLQHCPWVPRVVLDFGLGCILYCQGSRPSALPWSHIITGSSILCLSSCTARHGPFRTVKH